MRQQPCVGACREIIWLPETATDPKLAVENLAGAVFARLLSRVSVSEIAASQAGRERSNLAKGMWQCVPIHREFFVLLSEKARWRRSRFRLYPSFRERLVRPQFSPSHAAPQRGLYYQLNGFGGKAKETRVDPSIGAGPILQQSQVPSITFRFPWKPKLGISIAIGLFFGWICIYRYHSYALEILPLAVIVRGFAELRRRIVLGPDGVIYIPPLGVSTNTTFVAVRSITRGRVGEIFLFGPPADWPAIVLQLESGVAVTIPVAVRDESRVFNQIREAWVNCRNRYDSPSHGSEDPDKPVR